MARSAKNTTGKKAAAKAAAKKSDVQGVDIPLDYIEMAEGNLRELARVECDKVAKAAAEGAESGVEMVSVYAAKPGHIAECGGKFAAGAKLDMPLSLYALYFRKDSELFEHEEGEQEETDEGGDGSADPAAKGEGSDVKPGEVKNDHNPEGTVQN